MSLFSGRRRRLCAGVYLFCVAVVPPTAFAGTPLSPQLFSNEQELADLLWQRASEVIAARAAVANAQSDVLRSRVFPNPTMDAQWGTIPLGSSNPSSLHEPLSNVPNYTAGIAELFELGKRGPRQAAARADSQRAQAEATAALGDRFFGLLENIGMLAMNQQRAAVLDEQIVDSEELLALDRARANKGEIAQLDADVVEVENARMVASRDAALSEMAAAQASCSETLALNCPLFASGEMARAFLIAGAATQVPSQWSTQAVAQRPDLQALDAAARGASQRVRLADRHKLPDPTLRLGYTYDEFVTSGNQRNSMAVGLQVPLPVFDHGQADRAAALAEKNRAERTSTALLAAGPDLLELALRRRALVGERIHRVDGAIERAHAVSSALDQAQRAGGTSLIEVLLARRAYQDLLRERIELDGEAYNAALAIRRILGIFPRPTSNEEFSKHDG